MPIAETRPFLGLVIVSLLAGAGQALAVILAVLPLILPDADAVRFLSHASIAAIVLQTLALILSFVLRQPRCPWVVGWRIIVLALSVGLAWSTGWGPGSSTLIGGLLVVSFVPAAGIGFLTSLVMGLTFAVACFGIGHPLMIPVLVPAALIGTWILTFVRALIWWAMGVSGHPRDIAVVALVGGAFAPTVMLLGGWLGHDTALLTAGFITQFIGFTAARWVARAVNTGGARA